MHAAIAVLVLVLGTTGYTLVLRDGSALRVSGEPKVERGLAIARLADGTVVSLPQARIDWEMTRKANASGGEAQDSAGRSRREAKARAPMITNKTIETFAKESPASPVPRTGAASSVSEAVPAPPASRVEPRLEGDDEGRGRAYWSERARIVRDRTRAAEQALAAAEKSLADEEDVRVHGRTVSARNDPLKVVQFAQSRQELAVLELRISQLRERVTAAEAEVEEARQREADLREEARSAGADPGWLRLPVAYRYE